MPFTTSFTEPSPPTITRSCAPSPDGLRGERARCPGSSEMRASPVSPSAAARCEISGQRRPVEPPAERG